MRRRSTVVLTALIALAPLSASRAQSPDERAVMAVIQKMFDGMRAADSAAVRSVFADGARFASIDARTTPPTVRHDPVDGWIAGVANSARRWDEQIYDVQVRVDAGMAQAWTPYTFYLDKQWRHCGVNAFELLNVGGAWKVTQISDTRRRDGCRDPLGTGPAPAQRPPHQEARN